MTLQGKVSRNASFNRHEDDFVGFVSGLWGFRASQLGKALTEDELESRWLFVAVDRVDRLAAWFHPYFGFTSGNRLLWS
jgi:hypothetical protein